MIIYLFYFFIFYSTNSKSIHSHNLKSIRRLDLKIPGCKIVEEVKIRNCMKVLLPRYKSLFIKEGDTEERLVVIT